jgi:hypothetical protein
MPLCGQSSGSPRQFNALSSFNVRPDSPALGAIYMPMLPWASCLAGSSNLAREDCAIIVWRHRSALTAKEVFYDAPHSCIPGAGDVHSAVVRPKSTLHTDRSGYTTGTDGNRTVNTYTDQYSNTTAWIGGKYISTYSDGHGGTTGTIGNKRITTYEDGYGNTTGIIGRDRINLYTDRSACN